MIKVLDSFIADKIAAGEVIERPLSIVKELIENSVDAGASSIIVEIRNGGKSYIRVTDNGCGIPADEVEIAFLRHATGKISTLDDLNRIETLGFRGEALASISAVSRLTVVTKDAEASTGTKLTMHGGQKVSRESVGANKGTTMIIEDVFYNIPARRKFMGSDAREAAAIIDLVQKLAIFYSHIRFQLVNNAQTVLSTEGDGDCSKAIKSIYPGKEFVDLIYIEGKGIHGYISNPGVTKNNRKGQIFFVNGRIVDSKVIENGIVKGYGDRIFSGYPIAILFIDVPPQDIDVNIHPGKKQIKFLYENDVISSVADAVNEAMSYKASIPSATSPAREERIQKETRQSYSKPAQEAQQPQTEQLGIREFLSRIPSESKLKESSSEPAYEITETENTVTETIVTSEAAGRETEGNKRTVIEEDFAQTKPFDFSELKLVGYFFNAYILTQAGENIYILDQHAAHERIFYEKLVGAYNSSEHNTQPILTPIMIETSQDVYNRERDWMDSLCRMGYDISDFGAGMFIIKGIPQYMTAGEADSFARAYIDGLDDYTDNNSAVINKLITRSCKSAVKANDALSQSEIHALLSQLAECRNPFSCPHGRPSFIKVSKYEIERSFKRK